MGNPYEAHPDVFEALNLEAPSDSREAAPKKTSEDVPDNPTQYSVPNGSIKEVLAWVDGDKDKARAALEAEKADEKPRRGLINELDEILQG